MSTFILNPDTIAVSDSIVVKLTRLADVSLNGVNMTVTTGADVEITKQISCAAIAIVAICVAGYVFVKTIEVISNYCSEERKKKRDEEECVRKQKAEEKNRTWQHEDQNRKQKNDLLERKLSILKAQCYELKTFEETKDDKNVKIVKEVLRSNCDDKITNYINAIENTPTNMTIETHE